jgi:hypothetical protein
MGVSPSRDPDLITLWNTLSRVFMGLLLAGAVAALADLRVAAWALALAGLTGIVASHLGISAVAYRRTMRREWPQVEPLPADDDW